MRGNSSLRYKASVQLLAHSANHCLWTTVCNQEVSVNKFTYLSRLCAFNNPQKRSGSQNQNKNQVAHQPFLFMGELKISN
jgi:hypothetical protein